MGDKFATAIVGRSQVKTEDLINLISKDARRPANLSLSLLSAICGGALLAGIVFFATIGFRHDIVDAIGTVRFVFKFLVTLSLLIGASVLLTPVLRPGADIAKRRWLLLIPPVLLVGAIIVELLVTPSDLWIGKLIGRNALHCLIIIPALSIFPAVPLFLAMRHGAPDNPGMAGAVAALASAGVAATLYASNCFDDSPLFVGTWYSIATAIVGLAGYFAGSRLLRW